MPKRPQTPKEELANAASHGFGLLLGLIAIPFLIQKVLENGEAKAWIGGIAFSIGILMVYTFSTFYHAAKNPSWKSKLQVLDHIAIYFLIAGSYTPMVLAVLKQDKAIIFLSILWASVLVGTFFKLFYTGRFKILSIIIYLTMGWLAVFFFQDIVERISLETLVWIGVGGMAYTIGVYFYIQSNKLYFHAIWHLFVLLGTIAHFVAVFQVI
ncbi:hemolysin III family protein [Algoriphagus sp.]|uniref:PAQR family membrane homeostasis protein TrhA n=1 Tax=Algoriphagus sp. TaxID=1872435 RepID=UPI00271CABB5|nr:hemolysin III family protein [Algoriphagus sp.]MDO8965995.1 hemolysin III family protein [Algoriphagus sp.]MDP3198521.1 hemolysin III family protein [Algoriphagus sp.]